MPQNEKRANSRLTIRDDVTLIVARTADSEPCVLENISQGGALFFSNRQLAIGDQAELRVPSLDERPDIVMHVKVVRVGPGDYDQQFGYASVIEAFENA